MGAWGVGILEDDIAADIHGDYMERFDAGDPPEKIRKVLQVEYAYAIEDMDEGPVFWLALAQAQWDTTKVDSDVLERVKEIVTSGQGLEVWAESGDDELAGRKEALKAFLAQIQTPKPQA